MQSFITKRFRYKPRSLLNFSSTLRNITLRHWTNALTILLIALLCWLLALWTWLVVLPEGRALSTPESPLSAASSANVVSARHLFGLSVKEQQAPTLQTTITGLKLRGVFAPIGLLPGFAVFNIEGKNDQPVRVGDEVIPGIILKEVHPAHVLLSRQGMLERLNLERSTGIVDAQITPSFKLNVQSRSAVNFSFSRNELNLALQDPKQLANVGRLGINPGGGLMVEEAPNGSLTEKLGLRLGDVLMRINGQPVSNQGDLQRLYQQLAQLGQVRLDIMRGGAPAQLRYTIEQ